jgi:hypothetical protein
MMSSQKPVTPRKGQKPTQPRRPGRPKKEQHIVVRSEKRAEPDYRLIARAVIRMVLDEQRRNAAAEQGEDDHGIS